MKPILEFINFLESFRLQNPDTSENLYSLDSSEGLIRRHNLKTYLSKMLSIKPEIMLLGEAPGYKGCRLSGIPFTSERLLKTNAFFCNEPYEIINSKPESEQSATIVWGALNQYEKMPLIWNIYPFHPHKENDLKSNRTPSEKELDDGVRILKELLTIFSIKQFIAIGRKAEIKLKENGYDCTYVRHPANGGKREFVEGLNRCLRIKIEI
ncbi:MAG: uracil-DNA glycosylase [Bacteroidota bacterium]